MTRFPDVPIDGDTPLEWGLLATTLAAVVFALSFVSGIDPAMTLAVLVGLSWLVIVFQIVVWTLEGYRDERGKATGRSGSGEQEQATETENAVSTGDAVSGTESGAGFGSESDPDPCSDSDSHTASSGSIDSDTDTDVTVETDAN